MFKPLSKRGLAKASLFSVLAVGATSPALAESTPQTPNGPGELVPQWESPFSEYQAFDAQPVLSWQGLNRRVAEIGGWRTYAMEPYEDDAAEDDPLEDQPSEDQLSEDPTDGTDHDAHSGGHQ